MWAFVNDQRMGRPVAGITVKLSSISNEEALQRGWGVKRLHHLLVWFLCRLSVHSQSAENTEPEVTVKPAKFAAKRILFFYFYFLGKFFASLL